MRFVLGLVLALSLAAAVPVAAAELDPQNTVYMDLTSGRVVIKLRPDLAPKHVERVKALVKKGFYDGTPFHRVIAGFMAQGGDPTGTGTGGPGYKFDDEINSHRIVRGTLAMANAGPNTNGSQFFIVLEDLRGKLDKNYTIFGRVTGGQDTVDKIAQTPTKPGGDGAMSSPIEPVTIEKVTITES